MPPLADTRAPLPRADVEARVSAELGHRIVVWTELGGGTNNRLVRLDLADGSALLAKFYARDRWDRLGTEFPALALLTDRGVAGVPRPCLRNDELLYAVYSFEPGHRKPPAEIDADDARAAAALASELHSFGPDDVDRPLGPANPACFSISEQVALIGWRVGSFEAALTDPECHGDVRAFAREIDLRAAVEGLIARATAGLAADQAARVLPRTEWRLNTNDFGPHNLLFADGAVSVVDFEDAGWDDPARMVMGFVSHAGSDGVSPAAIAAFLGAYAEHRELSAADVARYERVGRLYDGEWAAVYASALTPEAIEPKRFGVAGFDLSAHVATCIAKLQERLGRGERGDGYRFP